MTGSNRWTAMVCANLSEHPVDPPDGELEAGARRPRLGLALQRKADHG